MKIATYKDGSRDGQLLVVSRDLTTAHYATGIASRMQQLLDDWNFLSPQLEELSQNLNHGKARHAFAFDPKMCMAPLPRTSYLAFADTPPQPAADTRPLIRLSRGDDLLGACDAIPLPLRASPEADADETGTETDSPGLDFSARLAVFTGNLATATNPQDALSSIRLMGLACSWHHSVGASSESPEWAICSSFAPVAITPEELGVDWQDGHLELNLEIRRNGKRFALCDAGFALHFGEMLAQCAAWRGLRAGSIVGVGMPPVEDASGDASIGRRRQRELAHGGAARTSLLTAVDTLQLDIQGRDGHSLFGAIAAVGEAPV